MYLKSGKNIPPLHLLLTTLFFALISMATSAIDNPDTRDYVADFKAEAEKYESQIANESNGADMAKAYAHYEKFLDEKLNTSYTQLRGQLAESERAKLKTSQQAWLRFREEETSFITDNWTPANFGSSSVISRRTYIAAITRARIEQLLNYAKNY